MSKESEKILQFSQDGNNHVESADLESYLKYLIEMEDDSLDDQFIIAFPPFVDSKKVFLGLLKLYESAKNSNVQRKRIIKFLYKWIGSFYVRDFHHQNVGKYQFNRLLQFVDSLENDISNKFKLLILRNAPEMKCGRFEQIAKFRSGSDSPKGSKIAGKKQAKQHPTTSKPGTTSSLKTSLNPTYKFSMMDVNPMELAQQLTLIEWNLFSRIEEKEFYDMNWISEHKHILSPNIIKLVERFNTVSYWLATQIMTATKATERVAIMKKIIKTGEAFREIGNFNGVMEVVGGLSMYSVSRLKDTWNQLPSSLVSSYENLDNLMKHHGNYPNYREALKTCKKPVLPYLGVYLRDLTFTNEAKKQFLDNKCQVLNITKLNMMGSILVEIKQFQQHPYPFDINQEMQDALLMLMITLPEELLVKNSVLVEPTRIPLK